MSIVHVRKNVQIGVGRGVDRNAADNVLQRADDNWV